MPRAALSALCALPLAAAAAPLDALALLQGSAHVERELPKDLADAYLAMQKQTKAVQKEQKIKDLGDFAWNSGTMAVRLPDTMPSLAWGTDTLKGVSAYGLKKGDFVTGGLLRTGTDTKERVNALGGMLYTGLDPKNEQKLPSSFAVVAAGEVEPGKSTFVGAVPVEDKKDGPSLSILKAVTKVETGHLSPDKVPQYLGGKATATPSTHTPAKAEQKAPASTAPVPAKEEHKAPATTAPVPAKEEHKAAHGGLKIASLVEVGSTAAPAKAASLLSVQEDQQAGPAEQPISPEEEKRNQEWGQYQLKLMFLDFPIESAFWFAVMRGWANDHLLPEDEASKRLATIEGRWRVEKDQELPESQGKELTIQDGKLLSAGGEPVLGTTFQAYADQKYGVVSALKSPFDNSTVNLYKLFHINGTKLEFEGGNVWQRLSPAPAAPPAAALLAAAPAAAAPKGEQEAKVGSWLRNLQRLWKH